MKLKWIFFRIASILLITFTIFALSKLIVRSLPGTPLDTLIAETGTNLPRAMLEKELKLDLPYWPALLSQANDALHGNFGFSIIQKRPIAELLPVRMARSAALAFLALSGAIGISLVLILLAHLESPLRSVARTTIRLHGALSASMPLPWIAPVFAYVFAVRLRLFTLGDSVWLPAFCLAILTSGFWARLLNRVVEEELHAPPAQAARARGLSESRVLLKYAIAPALGPLLGYLGTQFGALLAGAFISETVFDWPGMGSLLIESVFKRDYPVVETTLFASTLLILLGNWLGDAAQRALDPKLRGLNR